MKTGTRLGTNGTDCSQIELLWCFNFCLKLSKKLVEWKGLSVFFSFILLLFFFFFFHETCMEIVVCIQWDMQLVQVKSVSGLVSDSYSMLTV